MLTSTAIKNPSFLQQVRRAMRMAGIRAIARGCAVTSATVRNRHGAPALEVFFHRQPHTGAPCFEFIDTRDNDITAHVRAALQSVKEV